MFKTLVKCIKMLKKCIKMLKKCIKMLKKCIKMLKNVKDIKKLTILTGKTRILDKSDNP